MAQRPGPEADSAQIAEAFTTLWLDVGAAVAKVIGNRGADAVVERSVRLSAMRHPWLAGTVRGAATTFEPTVLRSAFAEQGSAEAAAGGRALLQDLEDVLASLIGPPLAERLVRRVGVCACGDFLERPRARTGRPRPSPDISAIPDASPGCRPASPAD